MPIYQPLQKREQTVRSVAVLFEWKDEFNKFAKN